MDYANNQYQKMNTPPPKNNGIICRPAHFREIILYFQNNLLMDYATVNYF